MVRTKKKIKKCENDGGKMEEKVRRLFTFFQFSLEAQSLQLPSKEDTSSAGKGGGAEKVILQCHIRVYCIVITCLHILTPCAR